jgi:hypothetical protein
MPVDPPGQPMTGLQDGTLPKTDQPEAQQQKEREVDLQLKEQEGTLQLREREADLQPKEQEAALQLKQQEALQPKRQEAALRQLRLLLLPTAEEAQQPRQLREATVLQQVQIRPEAAAVPQQVLRQAVVAEVVLLVLLPVREAVNLPAQREALPEAVAEAVQILREERDKIKIYFVTLQHEKITNSKQTFTFLCLLFES